ncbi:hypothetical protein V2J09_005606 [Rumex salicifolius]
MAKLQSQALNLGILQLCVCCLVVACGGRNLHVEEAGRSSLSFDIVDTIYQFGDSLSDTGNAIRESASSGLCTSFPYGESFFHYVTGRCSDGLVMADYYATAFGLPFLNPYLDGNANFSNGADFSVSGASALNVEVLESLDIAAGGTNSSLAVQLRWFETHLKSICTSPSECRDKLKRSLFLMEAIGGNDYNYAFGDYKSFDVVYELVPYVIQAITDGIKDMILLGAVNIVVPGVVPFGCMPCFLASANMTIPGSYDELGCLNVFNEVSQLHNQKLYNATKELQLLYPNATIIYADYYSAIIRMMENADVFGFDKNATLIACCGSGDNEYNFSWDATCGNDGASVCSNPNERISWDGLHFTQQLYKYVSEWMLQNTIIPHLTRASLASQ